MNKLLIIDDDPDLSAMLCTYFENEDFAVQQSYDGESGLQLALEQAFSVIVLDIMLPGLNGIEVLKQIRQQLDTPVIMLTAKGDDLDRIIGLELGADDYLPKPCNPRELLARVKAILRRSAAVQEIANEPDLLSNGGLTLDRKQYSANFDGNDLKLTRAEFNIMYLLIHKAGEVVPKETLYETALGRTITAYDRSLDMHVSNIRKKLAAYTSDEIIANVRGIGYKLC